MDTYRPDLFYFDDREMLLVDVSDVGIRAENMEGTLVFVAKRSSLMY